ncbi:MAG: hypothetical protein JWN44_3035 [Myxococcales bacterium]|nr:hypothetical protein [Myxococcales bacterium]
MDVTQDSPRSSDAGSAASRAASVPAPFSGTLDDLLALDTDTLGILYQGARVPQLADVRGDLRGRMLAVVDLPDALAGAVRVFAGSDLFPWRGKSFTPQTTERGEGINRVISDRWKLYRFETFVGPSRAGSFDAVQLDYDLPSNPFFIRAIKDEIRELRPGLWLGQAWLNLAQPKLVLYFGLTTDGTR